MRMIVNCAKCNKPVDDLVFERDIARCGRYMTAVCHGEKDTRFVGDDEIEDDGVPTDLTGVAFHNPMIGHSPWN